MTNIIPVGAIERRIYQLRGQRVMLDADLAELYGVETRAVVQAVTRRHADRFPPDFMFQLTADEWAALRSQSVISNEASSDDTKASPKRGGRRYLPYVFTEHGCVMLSNVLQSDRAVQVSVAIVRAFVRLRSVLTLNADVARRVEALEQQVRDHKGAVDQRFDSMMALIEVIRDWMVGVDLPEPEAPLPKQIGFRPTEPGGSGASSKRSKRNK